jgi:hypothetical protein
MLASPQPGRKRHWFVSALRGPLSALFFGASASYWYYGDWWVYVGLGADRHPKFPLPVWWQIIESCIVGAAVTGMVALVIYGARLVRSYLAGRNRR